MANDYQTIKHLDLYLYKDHVLYCNCARTCMRLMKYKMNLDVWRFVGLLTAAAARSPELQCLNLLAVFAGLNKSNSIDLTETDWDVDLEGLHLGNIHNRSSKFT